MSIKTSLANRVPAISILIVLLCSWPSQAQGQVHGPKSCKAGQAIPGSFIIKQRLPAAVMASSAKARESFFASQRQSLGLRQVHSFREISDRLEQVQAVGPNTDLHRLEKAVQSGVLEYAFPNRVVCAMGPSSGYSVSGSVRVLGTSIPQYPRTIVAAGDAYMLTLSPFSGIHNNSLAFVTDDNPPIHVSFELKSLLPWDADFDGLTDFLSNATMSQISANGMSSQDFLFSFQNGFIGHPEDSPDKEPLGNSISRVYKSTWEPSPTGDGYRFLFLDGARLYAYDHGSLSILKDFTDTPAFLGDFDGDGDADVITERRRDESVGYFEYLGYTTYTVFKETTPGNFSATAQFEVQELESGDDHPDVFVADLNGDGKTDFLSYFPYEHEHFGVYINQGDDMNFTDSLWHLNESSANGGGIIDLGGLFARDLDGDGNTDLLAYEYSSFSSDCSKQRIFSIINDGTGSFPSLTETAVGKCISTVAVHDMDGDGRPDVVLSAGTQLRLYANSSTPGAINFDELPITDLDGPANAIEIHDPLGINGVRVTFHGPGSQVFNTITDLNGEFSLESVPAGTYQVQAQRSGYSFVSELGGSVNIGGSRSDINFHGLVQLTSPDGFVAPSGAPNDPGFGNLWGLYNVGQDGGIPGDDIGLVAAWKTSIGDSSLIVGVLDTGIDYNHPDLRDNIWVNSKETPGDGLDNDGNGYVDDFYGVNAADDGDSTLDLVGHGTHVSGTIGARGGNMIGVSGVAQRVRLMALRVLNAEGSGSDASIIKGMAYALAMRQRGENIRVINSSLGNPSQCNQAYIDTLSALNQVGVVFVAAAGNGGDDGVGDDNDKTPTTPSTCPVENVISVANLMSTGDLAPDSNYGFTSVDLGAPGTEILSTVPNGFYVRMSGTSMAAPHVTGVAALVMSREPGLPPEQVRKRLLDTAMPLAHLTGKLVVPGMVNAGKAIAAGMTPPQITKLKIKLVPNGARVKVVIRSVKVVDHDGRIVSVKVIAKITGGKKKSKTLKKKTSAVYTGKVTVTAPVPPSAGATPRGLRVEIRATDNDGMVSRKVKKFTLR